jgi:hypothetical protein
MELLFACSASEDQGGQDPYSNQDRQENIPKELTEFIQNLAVKDGNEA